MTDDDQKENVPADVPDEHKASSSAEEPSESVDVDHPVAEPQPEPAVDKPVEPVVTPAVHKDTARKHERHDHREKKHEHPTHKVMHSGADTKKHVQHEHHTTPSANDNRKEEMKENIIAIVIVILLVGALSWWIYARITAPPTQPDAATTALANIPIGTSPTLGNQSAKMIVVEFTDFECPYCGEFARDDFPAIKQQYIDTGKILFVFKNFPLENIHPKAEQAAEAAECANDQGVFWQYHDLLFNNQDKLEVSDLQGYAQQLSLNMSEFNSCMNESLRVADVAADKTLGLQSGVSGTPTFFFNGQPVVGVLSAAEFGSHVPQS